MAIKAGTVGVRWDQVNNEGVILNDGGGGVTDVEVNGESVVTDGVAEITLPESPNVILDEVSTASEADIAILTATSSFNLRSNSNTRLEKTSITIGETPYNLAVWGTTSGHSNIAIAEGDRIIATRTGGSVFAAPTSPESGAGAFVLFFYESETGSTLSDYEAVKLSNAQANYFTFETENTKRTLTGFSIKYYKIKQEV